MQIIRKLLGYRTFKNKDMAKRVLKNPFVWLAFVGIIWSTVVFCSDIWLNLNVEPRDFYITNFTGKYALSANSICINGGTLTNKNSLLMQIGKDSYELSEGELTIVFSEEDSESVFNRIVFDRRLNVYNELSNVVNGNIRLWRQDNSYLRQGLVASADSIDGGRYSYHVDSRTPMEVIFNCNSKANMTISNNMHIYIRGESKEVVDDLSINFYPSNGNSEWIMALSANSITYSELGINSLCRVVGNCKAINGTAGDSNSSINYAFMNEQKQYDIPRMQIVALANENFGIDYTLNGTSNTLLLSGDSKKVKLAGSDLKGYKSFIMNSGSTFISSILLAILSQIALEYFKNKKQGREKT